MKWPLVKGMVWEAFIRPFMGEICHIMEKNKVALSTGVLPESGSRPYRRVLQLPSLVETPFSPCLLLSQSMTHSRVCPCLP